MPQRDVMLREKRRKRPEKCYFCETKSELDYKVPEILRKFMTPRGKIVARSRSGICAKHQRKLSQAIKRAREIALL